MTLPGLTLESELLPVDFVAPPVNPSPYGLYSAVTWPGGEAAERLPAASVVVRVQNYWNDDAFGVWNTPWCAPASDGDVITIVDATSGTWTYSIGLNGTDPLAYNVSAADLQTALRALPGGDGVVVTGGTLVGNLRKYTIKRNPEQLHTVSTIDLAGGFGPAVAQQLQERKRGERPAYLDPFDPITIWAADECDLTAPSRAEIEERAAQVLRIKEQVAVERQFADRLKLDAADLGAPISANDLQWAVATLEAELTETGTLGAIHASPHLAVYAAQAQILIKSGSAYVTPLGHRWIFGGGYVDGLQSTLVATSMPMFGWRDEATVRPAISEDRRSYIAIAERSVTIGYEAVIASAAIS